ncbi:MAG: hypothetical protein EBT95_08490 [Verrucomicrobia bacterium]|nr:hypothetical protein [Verrucomicrobiota bacterium]
MEILAWAPGLKETEIREAFDSHGRTRAAFWRKREILAGVEPELRRDGEDLALAAVEHLAELLAKKNPGKATVVADDAALGRDLAGGSNRRGVRPIWRPGGRWKSRPCGDFCGIWRSFVARARSVPWMFLSMISIFSGGSSWKRRWSRARRNGWGTGQRPDT